MNTWNDLTADEKRELELAFDGPIPPRAIADKIRMRVVRDAAYLTKAIQHQRAVCAIWAGDLATARVAGREGNVDWYARCLATSTRKLEALQCELDSLTPAQHAAE